jgi:superfamily I DNA/RNA helicase
MNHADECRRVITIIRQILAGKVTIKDKPVIVHPHEIGILYRKLQKKDEEMFGAFIEELGRIGPVTWLSCKDRDSRTKVFEQSVKVQTVYSAKGLQYRVVFILWADQFDARHPADKDMEQRLLYVALTRASDMLIVTYSSMTEFVERMVASGAVRGK